DDELDGSAAMQAADETIATWTVDCGTDAGSRIRAAARAEFACHGYDLTTIRDIAAAAQLSPAGVYRHIESKDALFWSIMKSYADQVAAGWRSVLSSPSTPQEKIDGLLWLVANRMDRFAAEYKMHRFGLRHTPPTSTNPMFSFPSQLRQLKRVLAEGA